jgi:two-component sensor histidine kinase
MTRQGNTLRLTVAGGQAEVAPERRSVAASGAGLVKGLAAQLGGTFRVEQGGRTGCIVEFPEN